MKRRIFTSKSKIKCNLNLQLSSWWLRSTNENYGYYVPYVHTYWNGSIYFKRCDGYQSKYEYGIAPICIV